MNGYITKSQIVDNRFIVSELESCVDSPLGEIRETIIRKVIDTQEAQIRQHLIELGWTPPKIAIESPAP